MLQGVHIQRRRISQLPAHGLPLDRQRPHRSRHLPGQGSRFQLRIRIPRRPAQHARIVQPRPQRAPVRRMSRHRGRRFLHGVGTLRNRTAGQPQRPSDEHEPGRERVLGRAITRRIVYQFQSPERADRIWIQEVECFQKKDGKETVIPERGYTEIETHQIFY